MYGYLEKSDIKINKILEGNMNIEINENLFIAYLGLTATGYELASKEDSELQELVKRIQMIQFYKDIHDFFTLARTNQYAVNPYWPRGSAISSACIFINDQFKFHTFDDYIKFEHDCGFMDKDGNDAFISWIQKLPIILKQIKQNEAYPDLWNRYNKVLKSRIKAYEIEFNKMRKCLDDFGFGSMNLNITFVPNLLQSLYMADFVVKDGVTFVIATRADINSILHEFLHQIVNQLELEKYINNLNFSLLVDIEKMLSYGYMWDNSAKSKLHALEECIVRGLSAIMTATISKFDISQYSKTNIDNGFLLVPSVIEYSNVQKVNKSNLAEFIDNSIKCFISKIT